MSTITDKDIALIELGRAQAMTAISQVADTARFRSLSKIKKSKTYKGLSAIGPDGKVLTVSTFEDFCTHMVGMSRQHVDANIKLLDQLGDDGYQAAKDKELGYREMLKIARLPNELKDQAVQALISEETDKEAILEAVEELALRNSNLRRELEDRDSVIDQLESRTANLETELDTATTREEELKSLLKKERAGSPYPDFVVVTRHESHALSEKALLCVDDMHRLCDDLVRLSHSGGDKNSDEFYNYLRMSTATMVVHLEAVMSKAGRALSHLSQHLPPSETAQIKADYLYSDDEVAHAIAERELLVRDHEQEKQIRENQREANKPRGRGRPRKAQA